MRRLLALSLAATLGWAGAAAAAPVGDGLKISADSTESWSPWQARLAISAPTLSIWGNWASPQTGTALLAGDRYLGWGQLGDGGGLRATGALLLGPSALSLASPGGATRSEMLWRNTVSPAQTELDAPGAMPYLGLGYSAWWARTGLGVSADLGVAAQRPSQAVRFGRVMSGTEGLDDMLRAMQISPMLQVNLSYAF